MYEKEKLELIVKEVFSIAEVCRKLNIKPIGGNYTTIKKYFDLYKIDITHFTGQGWNTGDRYRDINKSYSIDEILIKDSPYQSTSGLKNRLIKIGLKKNRCEECDINSWNDKPISLHLDHINGDNKDNRIENLRILCPNCHSQTETYCKKKNFNEKKDKISFRDKIENRCECGIKIKKSSKSCNKCHLYSLRKVERPSIEQLNRDIKELGYLGTSKKYGVSDNSIRKWIKIN